MGRANIRFVEGHVYTRRQIHGELGGRLRAYLPIKFGEVVCACLKKKINPKAPYAICCGMGEEISRSGESLSSKEEPIPIFIFRRQNEWEYVGMYKVGRVTTNSKEMEKYSTPENGLLSRVILMKRAVVRGTKASLKSI